MTCITWIDVAGILGDGITRGDAAMTGCCCCTCVTIGCETGDGIDTLLIGTGDNIAAETDVRAGERAAAAVLMAGEAADTVGGMSYFWICARNDMNFEDASKRERQKMNTVTI